jgi:competence protein ComEA
LAGVGFLAVLPIAGEDLKAYPDGPGKDVFVRVCTRCHEAANTTKLRLTKRQWQGKVYAQADRGAEASGEELDQIVDYLARHFGPQK